MSEPLQWSQALEAEVKALRGAPALGADAPTDPQARARALYRDIHKHPTSALCLSGGGIRSGTFALGVLQGLAHLGLLGKFDYLSTVSGGGYIGGWLTAWLHRQGPEQRDLTLRALDPEQAVAATGSIDAKPVDYLRKTCRYLAPTGGAVSADFWTVLATLARNLLLNWFVVLPIIAAALLVPRLFYALTQAFEVRQEAALSGLQCFTNSTASIVFLAITLGAAATVVSYVAAVFAGFGHKWSQVTFLCWFLAPLAIGAVASSLFWAAFPCQLDLSLVMWVSAGLPAAGWIILALFRRLVRRTPGSPTSARLMQIKRSIAEFEHPIGLRTVLAAAAAGLIIGAGAYWFAMHSFGFGIEEPQRRLYAVFSVPLVFALVLLAIAVFVGLASSALDDRSLEWWSRCAAWIAIAMAVWLVSSVLVIYMAKALEDTMGLFEQALGASRMLSTGIVSTLLPLVASLAGLAARSTGPTDKPSATRLAAQQVILPAVIITLLSSIAWANLRGAEALEYHLDRRHDAGGGLGEVVLLGAVYLAFGLLMSYFVPVNRFSLHGMYRHRLIRTFLGASRKDREPNPFTGFDGNDDLRVHELADVRPLHVINATLNAVSSTKVGRHETLAQPFTFSPFHVGNRETGYRPSKEYGSDDVGPGTGLSLGLALAVSGAAASPAMGIHSTKATAFLLTLANARLGLWFGNPSSEKSWRSSEPPLGVGPILRELLGLTTDQNPFVYLSDGGHYENLGLWEMVARRNRFIVVSDAGCDPEYGFDDLSNAVRRVLLDLGVPIEFPEFPPLSITRAGQGHGNPHVAIGVIRYSVVDGSDAPDGTILYLKATLSGDEPVDVWNHARSSPAFPHDPTSEQFFDEARFESYRSLGYHTVLTAASKFETGQEIPDFFAAARATLDPSRTPFVTPGVPPTATPR